MSKDKLNDKQRLFLKIYQKNMGVVAKACSVLQLLARMKEYKHYGINYNISHNYGL